MGRARAAQARRPLGAGLSRSLVSWPAQVLCGVIGVFLLGVAIYSGLRGTDALWFDFSFEQGAMRFAYYRGTPIGLPAN